MIFSFKANATRMSRLMRDELVPGRDLAVYWIEHTLRHNGTKHLQLAGKDIPFYQRYMIDVILFLVAMLTTLLALLVIIIRWTLGKCLSHSTVKSKTS